MKDILHLKAPGNWINDPNGFIYYGGKYHLFYQYFPYAPFWGTMHWGHAVSEDLVHWEHLDVALFPTKGYDRNGVFSGSALEKDGRLYLYYSAVRYLKEDSEDIHRAADGKFETSQAMVISEDGFHFDNWSCKRQIIPVIRDEKRAHPVHTRDPKVWFQNGCYYMILGSTDGERAGRVVFFKSTDGEKWEYAARSEEKLGRILECPDLFPLGESHVFLGSPMYVQDAGKGYEHLSICTLAEFDEETCGLKLSKELGLVDYGEDLYAPQTNVDNEGRRVMIGWMRMPRAVEAEGTKPWNGMMCLPRVVEVVGGHIFFRVHPAVDRYFAREGEAKNAILPNYPCRIGTVLEEGETLNIGGYLIWVEEGYVKTDRSRVFQGIEGPAVTSVTPVSLEEHRLDIFVDSNLIEIFINDGEYVISHVVYGLGDEIRGKSVRIYTGNS
jgi:beta-fructofuranosidase